MIVLELLNTLKGQIHSYFPSEINLTESNPQGCCRLEAGFKENTGRMLYRPRFPDRLGIFVFVSQIILVSCRLHAKEETLKP